MTGETTTGFELTFYPGTKADEWALKLWDALDERRQRMFFWDFPPEDKAGVWCHELALADVFGVASNEQGAVLAFAWVSTAPKNSRVGNAHFAFTGEVVDEISDEFWAGIKQLGIYDSILAVQPLAFRGAREHAIKHGFKVLGQVPGLIKFYGRDKLSTGVILLKDMR